MCRLVAEKLHKASNVVETSFQCNGIQAKSKVGERLRPKTLRPKWMGWKSLAQLAKRCRPSASGYARRQRGFGLEERSLPQVLAPPLKMRFMTRIFSCRISTSVIASRLAFRSGHAFRPLSGAKKVSYFRLHCSAKYKTWTSQECMIVSLLCGARIFSFLSFS